MPDFDDIEKVAQEHGQQVDQGIDKADEEADKIAGGRDQGLIDKGADEAKQQIGGSDQQQQPADQQPPQDPSSAGQ